MSKISIREMTHSEFKHYCEGSYERFYQDAANASGDSIDMVKSRVGLAPQEPHPEDLWFVIEMNNIEVGYLWIRLNKQKHEAFGFDIFLIPEYRGRGIGREVMLAGRKILQQHEIKQLRICVFIENHAARSLYQSLGFREIAFNKEKRQATMEINI